VLGPALFGERALVGLHSGTLSPWRGALAVDDPALLEQAQRCSLPLLADKTIQFQPMLALALERLARGEVASWNPHNLGGVPLLAQGFHGPFHPINWLAGVLPPPLAFGWIAWAQALLAGMGAWALLRALGVGPRPALLAGSTWMLCGYVTGRWHWYMIQGCSAYLPWALLGIERLCMSCRAGAPERLPRSAPAVALTAAAIGLAWLTGWMQGALHLVYLAGIWTAARVLPALLAGGFRRHEALRCATRCGLGLLFGLMLAAPQLLPTLAWVSSGESARDVEAPEVVLSLGMNPAGLLGLLSPDNLGHPTDLALHPAPELRSDGALRRLVHKPNANVIESNGFVGVVVLLLACCGSWSRRRGRWLGLGLALGGLVLVLESPLLLALAQLPGLSSSDPLRLLLVWSLGATLLAAVGLQRVQREGAGRALVATALLLCLAAGAAASWLASLSADAWAGLLAPALAARMGVSEADVLARAPELLFDRDLTVMALVRLVLVSGAATLALGLSRVRPVLGAACLLGLALTEQGLAAQKHAVTVPAARLFEPPPLAQELAAGGRLIPVHARGVEEPLGGPFPGNTALAFGIDDLSGYYALSPRRVVDVFEALQPGSTFGLGTPALIDPAQLASPALAVLGLRQALSSAPVLVPGWAAAGAVGDAYWLRRVEPIPSAWFSSGYAVADEGEALDALMALQSSPFAANGRTPLSPLHGQAPPTQAPGPDAARIEIQEFSARPEQRTFTLAAPADGLLVLSSSWSPGWSATVDGQPRTVWPAWHALQAVAIPAGEHEVQLRYEAPGLAKGLAFGALGVLGLMLMLLAELRRR